MKCYKIYPNIHRAGDHPAHRVLCGGGGGGRGRVGAEAAAAGCQIQRHLLSISSSGGRLYKACNGYTKGVLIGSSWHMVECIHAQFITRGER